MATKQHGGPKDDQRDTQRSDVGGDEKQPPVKKPDRGDERQPGMGEDEKKTYVPEKERP